MSSATANTNQPKSRLESLWMMGAMVASLLAGFLQPPPAPSYGDDNLTVTRLAQFAITVVAGLLIATGARFRRKKDWWWWALISAAALVVAIGLYVYYCYLTDSYTAPYNEGLVLVGSDDAFAPGMNPTTRNKEELIMDHAGNVYEIWKKSSIDRRRTQLTIVFLLTLPFFTISIVTAVQTWQCLRLRR